MDMVSRDREVSQLQWEDLIQKIVVISSQIDDLRIGFGDPFHNEFEEGGMMFFPLSGFSKLPPVYDITV